MLAGGAMTGQSRFGGDGHDVLIGGAGDDLFFGTLAEDVMIFEFGRVRFADGQALSAVVLGQRPLDLAASQMFDLYLKPALESPRYVVPPIEPADRPLREPETTVSTGDTEWPGTHGSGAPQVVSLPEVAFGYGSTAVPVDAEALLASISQLLAEFPGAVIEIAGHTDSTGGDAFNQALSQQRADAVRDALIALGVDPARLRAVGYGESRPAADNGTEEGRERNRRVEISISGGADAADAAEADATADQTAALGVLALQGWRSTRHGIATRRRRIDW
jgi:outer membrane protein OmpA-like peptidoglycan-associated protein